MSMLPNQQRGRSIDDVFSTVRNQMATTQRLQQSPTPAGPMGFRTVGHIKGLFGGIPVRQYGSLNPQLEVERQAQEQAIAQGPRNLSQSLFSSMLDAAQQDTQNLQTAADEQYARLNDAVSGYRSFLGSVDGRIRAGEQAGVGALRDAAGQVLGLRDQIGSSFDQRTRGILPQLDQDISRVRGAGEDAVRFAQEYGERAVGAANMAVQGFDSGYHAQISNAAAMLERRALNDTKEFEAMAASGQYSPAQIAAARRERQFDMDQQIGAVKADLGMRYESTRAQLGMQLSQVIQQSGDTVVRAALEQGNLESAVAGLRSQVATALSGQGLEADGIRSQLTQVFAGLREQEAALRSSSALAAVNALTTGNTALYEMISGNPRSVVSMLAGLAQIASIATAPGGPAFVNQGGGGGGGGGGGISVGPSGGGVFAGGIRSGPSRNPIGTSSIGSGSATYSGGVRTGGVKGTPPAATKPSAARFVPGRR